MFIDQAVITIPGPGIGSCHEVFITLALHGEVAFVISVGQAQRHPLRVRSPDTKVAELAIDRSAEHGEGLRLFAGKPVVHVS